MGTCARGACAISSRTHPQPVRFRTVALHGTFGQFVGGPGAFNSRRSALAANGSPAAARGDGREEAGPSTGRATARSPPNLTSAVLPIGACPAAVAAPLRARDRGYTTHVCRSRCGPGARTFRAQARLMRGGAHRRRGLAAVAVCHSHQWARTPNPVSLVNRLT